VKEKHTDRRKHSDDAREVVALATAWVTALAVRVGGEIRVPEEEIRALINGRGEHRFEVDKTDGAYVIRVIPVHDEEENCVSDSESESESEAQVLAD
jgi:hypothetical protein